METTANDTSLSLSENTNRADSERNLATPHFDEQAIQSARRAVPLDQIRAQRFWRLGLVLMCGSILVGAFLGIVVPRHQKSEKILMPAASATPGPTSQNESSEPLSRALAHPEQKANGTATGTSQTTAEATGAADPREKNAVAIESTSDNQSADARETLHGAFNEWIAATNARDIQRQMAFYNHTVNAFYLTRNVPREVVRVEKSRVFGRADLIDIRAAAPGIRMSPDGRTATMRFRKKYAIEGGGEDRSGEVLQELRWRRTDDGWKIVSERDLRVIN